MPSVTSFAIHKVFLQAATNGLPKNPTENPGRYFSSLTLVVLKRHRKEGILCNTM